MTEPSDRWNAPRVRRLRRWLQLTQRAFADELGVRQQTVSEWETGAYQPRGASNRLLDIVAERAGFAYGETGNREQGTGDRGQGTGNRGQGTGNRE
jgi:transcriptional regulator with XRE-family HTH domain